MHFETPEKRLRIPILHGMEKISHFRSLMGTRGDIFRRWQPADEVQTQPSPMNTPAVITIPLLTFKNMYMEQMWRIDNCLNQAKQAQKFLEGYKDHLTSDDFPESSFCLVLLKTYQIILLNQCWNVELLWFFCSPFFWQRWLPFNHFLRTLSSPFGLWNESHCFWGILIFSSFYHYVMGISFYFSKSWTNLTWTSVTPDWMRSHFWCFFVTAPPFTKPSLQ